MRLIRTLRDAAMTRDPYDILARSAAAFFRAQNPGPGRCLAGRGGSCQRPRRSRGDGPQGVLPDGDAASHRRGRAATGERATTSTSARRRTRSPSYWPRSLDCSRPSCPHLCRRSRPAPSTPRSIRAFATAWALRGPVAERTADACRARLDRGLGRGRHAAPTDQRSGAAVRAVRDPRDRARHAQPPGDDAADPVPHRITRRPPPRRGAPHTAPRAAHRTPSQRFPTATRSSCSCTVTSRAPRRRSRSSRSSTAPVSRAASGSRSSRSTCPNCGYSESFDHEKVARSSATTQYPSGPTDREPIRTPVLDFIEDFVIAFVDALDADHADQGSIPRVSSAAASVGTWAASRPARPDAGLARHGASSRGTRRRCGTRWSTTTSRARRPGDALLNWEAAEPDDSRRDYFQEVYDTHRAARLRAIHPAATVVPGRTGSPASAPHHRLATGPARGLQRRTSGSGTGGWPASSSSTATSTGSTTGTTPAPWRYQLNMVRQLLIGSAEDNFTGSNIFDATRTLAEPDGRDARNEPVPARTPATRCTSSAPVTWPGRSWSSSHRTRRRRSSRQVW